MPVADDRLRARKAVVCQPLLPFSDKWPTSRGVPRVPIEEGETSGNTFDWSEGNGPRVRLAREMRPMQAPDQGARTGRALCWLGVCG